MLCLSHWDGYCKSISTLNVSEQKWGSLAWNLEKEKARSWFSLCWENRIENKAVLSKWEAQPRLYNLINSLIYFIWEIYSWMNDSLNTDTFIWSFIGEIDRRIKRQEEIRSCTCAQWMLAIFTTNINDKSQEDAINWNSKELLESSLNHFFD